MFNRFLKQFLKKGGRASNQQKAKIHQLSQEKLIRMPDLTLLHYPEGERTSEYKVPSPKFIVQYDTPQGALFYFVDAMTPDLYVTVVVGRYESATEEAVIVPDIFTIPVENGELVLPDCPHADFPSQVKGAVIMVMHTLSLEGYKIVGEEICYAY